jgi:hypothetical protein
MAFFPSPPPSPLPTLCNTWVYLCIYSLGHTIFLYVGYHLKFTVSKQQFSLVSQNIQKHPVIETHTNTVSSPTGTVLSHAQWNHCSVGNCILPKTEKVSIEIVFEFPSCHARVSVCFIALLSNDIKYKRQGSQVYALPNCSKGTGCLNVLLRRSWL